MNGDHLPPPSEVIDLYQSSNIQRIRLYDPNQEALEALKCSGIAVLLGVPNSDIYSLANDSSAASTWIQNNIQSFLSEVHFRYIAVGNELIPDCEAQYILPAMQNLQNALQFAGLQDKIKVSTSVSMGVLGASYPPSTGAFSSDVIDILQPIISFLAINGAPLLANIYPYFSYVDDTQDISIEYALFTSPGTVVTDPNSQLSYQNLFDASLDALYSALEKAGGADVAVVVSETGWPSDGGTAATVENAQTYISNLVHHVGQGTPKRPGWIEAYVFAMFDENQKQPQGIQNHFGLFTADKQPKYTIMSYK
ncbi:hypothetical protein KFK09_000872 [Dendrobium nobile]|uniref:Glucan endo-1,3-beta-D-glucosidase n=1 Tax=Dendrobium nobile TaxID=94219 RepID=A0A8T3CF49_DENNO|nr:hypothetical protein KFK09_000872 [Dendrobium nobile]